MVINHHYKALLQCSPTLPNGHWQRNIITNNYEVHEQGLVNDTGLHLFQRWGYTSHYLKTERIHNKYEECMLLQQLQQLGRKDKGMLKVNPQEMRYNKD